MSNARDIIIKNIYDHLTSLKFSEANASRSAQKGWEFFDRAVCNSRDPFKDACDHAGAYANLSEPKIKYKSPKAKASRRTKKPQSAFDF